MIKKALPYFTAFVLLLALAALCTYWWMALKRSQPSNEPVVVAPSGNAVARSVAQDVSPIARLMGSVVSTQAGNIKLQGIIASGSRGVALLVQDGNPARAIIVGQEMVPGVVLTEVRADSAVITRNGVRQELNLPVRPPAAGITRVSASGGSGGSGNREVEQPSTELPGVRLN